MTRERITPVITDFDLESIWIEPPSGCGRSGDMRPLSRAARFARFAASPLLLACAAVSAGCDEKAKQHGPTAPPKVARSVATVNASASKPSPAERRVPPAEVLNLSEIPDETPPAPAASGAAPAFKSKLVIDEPMEIGPAGQMTASERGVVMLNRADEVLLAKRLAGSSGASRESARFSTIKGGANDFFAVARGPLLLRNKAYWVKEGKLVRRALDNSAPLEILANDARNGTRVVGADLADAPAHAVYISNPVTDDAAPRAKLWVEGGETVVLSPEGAGASSVAVASTGRDLFTVAIDARSAMTPMHGRRVRFVTGKPEFGPDVVMWVGSTSQMLSEVFANPTPFGLRAFLPIERDVSHFGLVMLELGSEPHMDPRTFWRGYPNGLDVAPVASASFCGGAFVAYVRPENPQPESRQLLELAEITDSGLGPAETVGSALGFANVSLAAATSSAILAYVADFRTFATTLRCPQKK